MSPTEAHRREAQEHRRLAGEHRAKARDLIDAERRSCAELDEDTIVHSPFYHREDILTVEAIRKDGEIRGASVTFRKVRGLTSEWMENALACHLARAAAMGFKDFMPDSPASIRGASVAVSPHGDTIIVKIQATDGIVGAAIWGRALRLLDDTERPTGN